MNSALRKIAICCLAGTVTFSSVAVAALSYLFKSQRDHGRTVELSTSLIDTNSESGKIIMSLLSSNLVIVDGLFGILVGVSALGALGFAAILYIALKTIRSGSPSAGAL